MSFVTKDQCIQSIKNNIRFVRRNEEGPEDVAAWEYQAEMESVLSDIIEGRLTNYNELFSEYGRLDV